ncbi:helix-turn-helix transcriptional regulator, partial [Devosia sp.]|uniref:helix-turn-helix transcriptional regulator n=1 Tax=Devosia sp. TaxID=1871048 RepID=UPI002FCA0AAD
MARPDRLFRLLHAMRFMPAPITAARLAEETEVSLRSLYRDIDSLRAAGARIEGERGYGYRLVEDYALPPQTFDRTEIEALALGLAQVRGMGDPALAKAANSALAKVAASLPDDREQQLVHAISQIYRPDSRIVADGPVALIREACWQEEAIEIGYTDKDGQVSERTILPLCFMYTDRKLLALAWCGLRNAYRMFDITRISRPMRTGQSFRPRRVVMLREYLAELN